MSLPSRRAPGATSDPIETTSDEEAEEFRLFQNSTSREAEQKRHNVYLWLSRVASFIADIFILGLLKFLFFGNRLFNVSNEFYEFVCYERDRLTRSRVYSHCHLNCVLYTCHRGPNSGRKIYRSINNRTEDNCRYFKWIDEVEDASYGTHDEYEEFEAKICKKLYWIIFLIKVFIATVLLDIAIRLWLGGKGSRDLTRVKQNGKKSRLAWKSSYGGKNRDDTCSDRAATDKRGKKNYYRAKIPRWKEEKTE
ncbi:hypothetical protein M5K25_027159 [Dendrobium thyrsiflorum]|uniref:GRF-type domain-containing protein n=1 Tax=Dendrobium thyrsiflorum TaxID=117978 RepID=A0ABD0TZ95_DENTH